MTMTPEELSERVDNIISRDILACQSALVDDLIKLAYNSSDDVAVAFEIENVVNLYPDPSNWSAEKLEAWLEEDGVDFSAEHEALEEALGQLPTEDGEEPDQEDIDDAIEDYCVVLRDIVRDNAVAQETYEWWLVTEWLAEKLKEEGEPVLDNDYGYWWGRTCSGQAISMDGTIQDIVRALYNKYGS